MTHICNLNLIDASIFGGKKIYTENINLYQMILGLLIRPRPNVTHICTLNLIDAIIFGDKKIVMRAAYAN